MKTRVETYARGLDQGTTNSVRSASAAKVKARLESLPLIFDSPEDARSHAAAVKSYVLDNLKELLLQFEANCVKNGIQVHWAKDAESANRQIIEICNSARDLDKGSPSPAGSESIPFGGGYRGKPDRWIVRPGAHYPEDGEGAGSGKVGLAKNLEYQKTPHPSRAEGGCPIHSEGVQGGNPSDGSCGPGAPYPEEGEGAGGRGSSPTEKRKSKIENSQNSSPLPEGEVGEARTGRGSGHTLSEDARFLPIENRKSKIENSQEPTSPPSPLSSDTFRRRGGIVVKAKSMASEEIHLNKHLEEAGYEVVETDLGEFVVQIDQDTPSHIVTPIIHKNLKQVSQSFKRENLGPYTEVAEELTMQARVYLREKFKNADIGISGVNFGIASSGRLVLLENEGNNRLSTTAPKTHIAIMGIEKIVPSEADLATFIPLLAASATGQKITTYVHFIAGPTGTEGPEEVHLILLDNGRSNILKGQYKDILRCIRCGACLNVCPVYRQASGHGYGHVYSGPLGAVLAPALEGVEHMGDLAKASSLCGACEEVCPVKIPIPHMLLMLRDEDFKKGVARDGIPWSTYDFGAKRSFLWKAGLSMLPMAEAFPSKLKSEWKEFRDLPERKGRSFRGWWRGRS